MIKRPGPDHGVIWFLYKTRRKFHVLQMNGTLFHAVPSRERHIANREIHRKKSRLRRRRFRHLFFYFRTTTLRRYNRRIEEQLRRIKEGPKGYERLSGKPAVNESRPIPQKPKLSLKQRIRRMIRLARYVRKKRKNRTKPLPSTNRADTLRKLRYLYSTGKLFKLNYRALPDFLNRNYSFLGKGKYLIIILNSTVLFILAYLFVFILKETATAVVATSFDIKAVMMYYDVEYLIRGREWIVEAVKVVFSTAPFITFILMVISLIVFSLAANESWTIRLFILWVIFHAFTQSFGEIIFGSLLNQGFGWVLAYLYFSDTEKMLLVVGVLVGMIAGGLFLSRFVLLTGNIYFNNISKANRAPFLMSQVLLPFLAGFAMIFVLKQPFRNPFELIVEASMILIILPAFLGARLKTDLFFDEEPRNIQIKWRWILTMVVVLILFRIFLWQGIRF